jgi:U32 family peptidase
MINDSRKEPSMPELLAPAGTLEKLTFAIDYGADAVYAGGPAFGMRAFAGNFNIDELAQGITYAHHRGKRVYITVNIIPHNDDLEGLPEYIATLRDIKADAIILSDPAVLQVVREVAPEMELHLSTQANAVNWQSVRFWQGQGIRRVILARELSLDEISLIRAKAPDVELEVFVHGAMCVSYSGRCLISMYMTGRDANKGECAHPCRYQYALVEEKRPGEYFPIEEDARGTYIMNSKDLMMLPNLKDVIATGVDGLKIEGRMKSAHYVATVTRAYRIGLDAALRGQPAPLHAMEELAKISHRPYTTGFYYNKPTGEDHVYDSSTYQGDANFVGLVLGFDPARGLLIEQRGNFRPGDELEIVSPGSDAPAYVPVTSIVSADTGEQLDAARHPQQHIYVPGSVAFPAKSLVRTKRR